MGIFVVIEGVEGSGKSSLIRSIDAHYKSLGLDVLTTKEPGGTCIGEKIREIVLLRESNYTISPIAELLLFAADRAEHCNQVLIPSIKSKDLVLCDRFIYSTLAYQGYGAGIPLNIIKEINSISSAQIKPDVTLLLDVDPVISLTRAKSRVSTRNIKNDDWNYFEKQDMDFHNKVRNGFLQIATSNAEFFILNAGDTREQIFEQSKAIIDKVL